MPAGCDDEGAVGAPELPHVLDDEVRIPQPLLRLGVIRRDDGGVAEDRRGVALGEDQVDLRSLALEPAHRIAQRLGGLDLLEPEQAPEIDHSIRLVRRHLEGHVLKHGPSISERRL